MQPALMLGNYRGRVPRDAALRQQAFVDSQAAFHRQRGDDPHLRSCNAVGGNHLHATDGELGHIAGFLIDVETWTLRYLIVNTSDWWFGHHVLVAPAWIEDISWLEATVSVGPTRQAIKDAPPYIADTLPTREQERKLHEHTTVLNVGTTRTPSKRISRESDAVPSRRWPMSSAVFPSAQTESRRPSRLRPSSLHGDDDEVRQ